MTQFDAAHPLLADALEQRGFTAMTDVQSAVLAEGCAGRDLLVSAQTGSGKTVAFGLSVADHCWMRMPILTCRPDQRRW